MGCHFDHSGAEEKMIAFMLPILKLATRLKLFRRLLDHAKRLLYNVQNNFAKI
jgi:hypothetical protein